MIVALIIQKVLGEEVEELHKLKQQREIVT